MTAKEYIAYTKERLKKLHESIPEIHMEILKYSNHRTKDEVLEKYPEHTEFINTIVFPK